MADSSGTTAISTSSDTAVTALTVPAGSRRRKLRIINEGTAGGFYSIDAAATWHRIPPGPSSVNEELDAIDTTVLVKREAGGTNLASVYVSLHQARTIR